MSLVDLRNGYWTFNASNQGRSHTFWKLCLHVMDAVDENWKTVADCLKSVLCKLLVVSSYADMPVNVTASSIPPARRQDLVRHALPCQESADEL